MPGKAGSGARVEAITTASLANRGRSRSLRKTWSAKLMGAFFSLLAVGLLSLLTYVLIMPTARHAISLRQRTLGMSNAKQIAEALTAYRRIYGSYPSPTVVDAAGKPLYSWRVLILPQLGYSSLYNEFQLDQSWDSPTNLDLMTRMPSVYACPGNLNALAVHETNFALIVGPGSLFPLGSPVDPDKMLDQPSETLLVVDTKDGAYTWSQPADISTSNGIALGSRPMIDIGGNYPDCAIAATVDGNPLAIKASISRASLDAIITPNGEENIDLATVLLVSHP
jgi:Protein of unknown function (DUF1559)